VNRSAIILAGIRIPAIPSAVTR